MFKKISFAVAVSAITLLSTTFAYAGTTQLSGWANSSNVGWISFNSSDTNTGTGGSGISATPYAVSLATTSGSTVGTLSGSAWSPSIGYISFDRSVTGNPPSNDSGSGPLASINMSTGAVSGWARAINGCKSDLWNGTNCTGNGPGKDNGVSNGGSSTGWDGWIELSGTNHATVTGLTGTATSSAGVSLNTSNNQFSGFAWGSDVVGWLSFNSGSNGNNNPPVCIGTECPGVNNSINISCNNPNYSFATINAGGGTMLTSGVTVIANGGTGTYSYQWSNNGTIGTLTNWGLLVAKVTYPSVPATTTYYLYVQAKDSTGIKSSQIACGTVTVNGTAGYTNTNQSANPELWKAGPSKPTGSGTGGAILPTDKFIYTIRPGSNFTLNYDWPTTQFPAGSDSGCIGYITPMPSGFDLTSWTKNPLSLTENGNTLGVTTIQGFPTGVYQLQIQCTPSSQPTQPAMNKYSDYFMAALENLFAKNTPNPPPTINSNFVELDVVPSSVQEK